MSPSVSDEIRSAIAKTMKDQARVETIDFSSVPTEPHPATIVMTSGDMIDSKASELLQLCERSRPGRPILLGATADRDTLLAALNQWRVFQNLPSHAPTQLIVDTVRSAYNTLRTNLALQRASNDLIGETKALDETLANLKETQQRLLHSERLTTLGRITGGLASALGAPMETLDRFQTLAAARAEELKFGNMVEYAEQGLDAIHSLLGDIRTQATEGSESIEVQHEHLDQVVQKVVEFSRFDELGRNRQIETDLRSGAELGLDRARLHQAVLNLLRNAFQATDNNERITVRTRKVDNRAMVEVGDSGPGIPREIQEKLFEPFFSTKGNEGLGLGLQMARLVAHQHGGTVSCESEVGNGTRFQIWLPLS
jgi:two-component system, NtrC family, sensor kinase